MVEKKQEFELIPRPLIGKINSNVQVKKFLSLGNTENLLKGWTPISCKGRFQQIKAWLKNQTIFSEDQNKQLTQKKDNSPVEAPQASTGRKLPKQGPKRARKPQRAIKWAKEGKGKERPKWNKPYPQNCRIPKREKTAIDTVLNMARTLMKFKIMEEIMYQLFPKDLVKTVYQIETCNKDFLTNLRNFQYLQQNLGREILKVE
ncbi:hypothetical protein O181_014364 [Austropuccinia psidii MF-1]|uniref:Uncharacterized protein n=1 Tax=Austropuccinia psidii MF-1 TaxID=1389203 RepID=A0A9Q3BZZ1_9BASI|nr:hypothetical protein [Austropuccinia psidii MF-1]